MTRPWRLRLQSVAIAAIVIAWALRPGAFGEGVSSTFTDNTSVTGNTFATDILSAPTSLGATGGVSIGLHWNQTGDSYASGYHIYRSATAGGTPSLVGSVLGLASLNFTDSVPLGTYFYVVRAYYHNWESTSSNQVQCLQVVAVFVC